MNSGFWSKHSVIRLFLFLLLFSNLLSRAFNADFNVMFYVMFVICFLIAAREFSIRNAGISYVIFTTFAVVYVIDPRYDINANLLSLKDVVIPLLAFPVGQFLYKHRIVTLTFLKSILPLFILYGIFQQIAFFTGNLENYLPWDAAYVTFLLDAGTVNVYQGLLLRFFGVMNAMVEYQIFIIILPLFLILTKEYVERKWTLYASFILGLLFIVVSLERSPLLMLLILVLFWKHKYIKNKIRTIKISSIIGYASVVIVVVFLTIGLNNALIEDEDFGKAYERLVNVVTLNLGEDEAVAGRTQVQWADAFSLSLVSPFGVGPGKVVPAAASFPGYISPHNNFLIYALAYGYVGLVLFLLLISRLVTIFSKKKENVRYFGYGMVASYLAMSMFNYPFLGKTGILFFLLYGFIASTEDAPHESQNMQTTVSE
jgi:O-Antigen ligase